MPLPGVEHSEEASSFTQLAQPPAARVIVPYTTLRPEVIWALQEAGADFELIDVSGSYQAYCELLTRLWLDARTFTIVEHDIVVKPGLLESLDACELPWCVAKYGYLRGEYWGLGCTRFRSGLLAEFPDVAEQISTYEDDKHPPGHWCTLDAALTRALRQRRCDWPHVHGIVRHLGDQLPAHGCRG